MLLIPVVVMPREPINWLGLPNRFMNKGELEVLCTLMRSAAPRVVAEFGINTGRTAKAILREVPGIERYIGVDVPPGYVTSAQVQRNEVPQEAGELVRGDPRVEVRVLPRGSRDLTAADLPPLDAVFIDGDHSRAGVEHDTALARALVRKGGIIIWHDYHDRGTVDVREVLHEEQDRGAALLNVSDTWLVYERVQ